MGMDVYCEDCGKPIEHYSKNGKKISNSFYISKQRCLSCARKRHGNDILFFKNMRRKRSTG